MGGNSMGGESDPRLYIASKEILIAFVKCIPKEDNIPKEV
jgi:hypothetical protein